MLKEIDKKIGISRDRYRLLFSLENSYGIFRIKDLTKPKKSRSYECIYFSNHDCVYPSEVLVDIMYKMRAGDNISLSSEDIVSVCVNGLLYSYRFYGVVSWRPDHIEENFEFLDINFFQKEKENILNRLHKNGMVLNVLDGSAISIHEESNLSKISFYGIEKETYPFRHFNLISEYSIYKLTNDKITNVNPNGSTFYDIKNALFYFLKKCQTNKNTILLYNRKELEMIKDYYDIRAGLSYGT